MEHKNNATEIYAYISEMFQNCDSATVFEIGAARAEDTKRILSLCPQNTNYHAFEPDPRNIEFIKTTDIYQKINLSTCAVGNFDGETEFYLSGGVNPEHHYEHVYSSSIKKPKVHLLAHPWCKFEKTVTVPVTRLDTYTNQNNINHIDFLWADMQGAEDCMIEGGIETLKNVKYLYMEYNNEEMYETQPTLEKLLSMVPDFERVHVFYGDILLENRNV